jgi:hypothetical protein
MGFWSTFLSGKKCHCCGSYDTEKVRKGTLAWDKAIDYIYYKCDFEGTIDEYELYICNECRHYTWKDRNGKTWWTSPK